MITITEKYTPHTRPTRQLSDLTEAELDRAIHLPKEIKTQKDGRTETMDQRYARAMIKYFIKHGNPSKEDTRAKDICAYFERRVDSCLPLDPEMCVSDLFYMATIYEKENKKIRDKYGYVPQVQSQRKTESMPTKMGVNLSRVNEPVLKRIIRVPEGLDLGGQILNPPVIIEYIAKLLAHPPIFCPESKRGSPAYRRAYREISHAVAHDEPIDKRFKDNLTFLINH